MVYWVFFPSKVLVCSLFIPRGIPLFIYNTTNMRSQLDYFHVILTVTIYVEYLFAGLHLTGISLVRVCVFSLLPKISRWTTIQVGGIGLLRVSLLM